MAIDFRSLGIALFSIFLGATGQFLFRVGMLHYGRVSVENIWRQFLGILFTPAIFAGFFCFGLSSILWLVVISKWELSYAYPMVALGYVLAVFYGTFLLQETVNLPKLLGIFLILLGIFILGIYGQSAS